eukprot:TRINITY_DN33372_c0_g1_i12.p2 TRINITY_DN33372_c0_g1~~TRINITY_DN33372_c0_g1_i12.p2  ORF type:complete len:336 (-),score=90.78 TRINITY_DN33372_c0_g1_i12:159-1166(-)
MPMPVKQESDAKVTDISIEFEPPTEETWHERDASGDEEPDLEGGKYSEGKLFFYCHECPAKCLGYDSCPAAKWKTCRNYSWHSPERIIEIGMMHLQRKECHAEVIAFYEQDGTGLYGLRDDLVTSWDVYARECTPKERTSWNQTSHNKKRKRADDEEDGDDGGGPPVTTRLAPRAKGKADGKGYGKLAKSMAQTMKGINDGIQSLTNAAAQLAAAPVRESAVSSSLTDGRTTGAAHAPVVGPEAATRTMKVTTQQLVYLKETLGRSSGAILSVQQAMVTAARNLQEQNAIITAAAKQIDECLNDLVDVEHVVLVQEKSDTAINILGGRVAPSSRR